MKYMKTDGLADFDCLLLNIKLMIFKSLSNPNPYFPVLCTGEPQQGVSTVNVSQPDSTVTVSFLRHIKVIIGMFWSKDKFVAHQTKFLDII